MYGLFDLEREVEISDGKRDEGKNKDIESVNEYDLTVCRISKVIPVNSPFFPETARFARP
jgi:hypothetical protein